MDKLMRLLMSAGAVAALAALLLHTTRHTEAAMAVGRFAAFILMGAFVLFPFAPGGPKP